METRVVRWLWWLLLPYAGWWMGYRNEENPPPWYAYPLAGLWKCAGWYMDKRNIGAFPPPPPIVCNCDYCRGVPGARFEP